MEAPNSTSTLQQYRVVQQDAHTYGISPSDEHVTSSPKKYERCQTFALAVFFLTLIIFAACLYCKTDRVISQKTPWSVLLVPFFISLAPLGTYVYVYLKSRMGVSPASLFCMEATIMGIVVVCGSAQIVLFVLRADSYIAYSYAIVCIPMYLGLVAPLIYFVIVLPLCITCHAPFHYYGTLIVVYTLALCISIYYLVRKLDFPNLDVPASYVFVSLWAAMGVHLVGCVCRPKARAWTAVFLVLALTFSLFQYAKVAGEFAVPWWIMTTLFALTVAVPLFMFN